ncbi:hypothetical protein [Simiduia litorea]|uniref:hypothetical protein n=1 Tax=Simiduia litorea TaxID=1435348 RepID=UPI0036F24B04
MDSKIAGVLSLLGATALIAFWWVYLFAARPDCLDSFQSAIDSVKYALSPVEAGSWIFVATLVSIVLCLTASLIQFFGKQKRFAMYLVAAHTVAAIFIYTWSVVLLIAAPLYYFVKFKNA